LYYPVSGIVANNNVFTDRRQPDTQRKTPRIRTAKKVLKHRHNITEVQTQDATDPHKGAKFQFYGRFVPATGNLSTASQIGVYTAFFVVGCCCG
jgi:hypothetical protein